MWVTPQRFTGMHIFGSSLRKKIGCLWVTFSVCIRNFHFGHNIFCVYSVLLKSCLKKNPQKTLLTTFQSIKAHREPNGKHLWWCPLFRGREHWYSGVSFWNPPHWNTHGHSSFWKTWHFWIINIILPICSTDIPLKWVPSYCRCSVQIPSCLWLRRRHI